MSWRLRVCLLACITALVFYTVAPFSSCHSRMLTCYGRTKGVHKQTAVRLFKRDNNSNNRLNKRAAILSIFVTISTFSSMLPLPDMPTTPTASTHTQAAQAAEPSRNSDTFQYGRIGGDADRREMQKYNENYKKNKNLLDYVFGTITTMFFDPTGGSKFADDKG